MGRQHSAGVLFLITYFILLSLERALVLDDSLFTQEDPFSSRAPFVPDAINATKPEGGSAKYTLRHQQEYHAVNQASVDTLTEEKICFVTAEFSETLDAMDTPPPDSEMEKDAGFKFFSFTNQPSWIVPPRWTKIVLGKNESALAPLRRQVTESRWPKFLGWKHEQLRMSCQVIFYFDAYIMNPTNRNYWLKAANKLRRSNLGIMQPRQIGLNNQEGDEPIQELIKCASVGKVSWDAANYTISWLNRQADYDRNGTIVYKNAIFGYDPHDPKFRRVATSFWEEYSKERGSWRDQPYWAYFLRRNNMTPASFPKVHPARPPYGASMGTRGHNGHIYV